VILAQSDFACLVRVLEIIKRGYHNDLGRFSWDRFSWEGYHRSASTLIELRSDRGNGILLHKGKVAGGHSLRALALATGRLWRSHTE